MPADNRQFTGSVSIRLDGTRTRLELSPAELHGGEPGLYRVRAKRRWLDAPEGNPLFFDRARLAELIAGQAVGESADPLPEAAPDIPRNSRVTVKFWHNDMPHIEGVWTASPPYRGFDGRFYVWVMTYKAGFIAVPVENVTPRNRHEKE